MRETKVYGNRSETVSLILGLFKTFCVLLTTSSAQGAFAYQESCDSAARFAARESDVPLDVLFAITRLETGRREGDSLQPWPWTVNVAGDGFWFPSLDEALAFTFNKYKSGTRSFDVGCFQLNYKWHGREFSSIRDMFDPRKNAVYAAEFLSRLYDEFGNWELAAGAYHSRTRKYSERYKARFREARSRQDADAHRNTWRGLLHNEALPFLPGNGKHQSPGSLVSLENSNESIIDLNRKE